ncbi:hypothetical protein BDN70DRAFT_359641 [Pholiota conissans]|uniref:Uncharacterized protein n=1 Tax=Pholiota conissans TaxID=109636 RepID=A0A9P5Z8T6_9AGAR|nr:hypothetical protein BDN70DRAFT_359641 [Pholiota conissans]
MPGTRRHKREEDEVAEKSKRRKATTTPPEDIVGSSTKGQKKLKHLKYSAKVEREDTPLPVLEHELPSTRVVRSAMFMKRPEEHNEESDIEDYNIHLMEIDQGFLKAIEMMKDQHATPRSVVTYRTKYANDREKQQARIQEAYKMALDLSNTLGNEHPPLFIDNETCAPDEPTSPLSDVSSLPSSPIGKRTKTPRHLHAYILMEAENYKNAIEMENDDDSHYPLPFIEGASSEWDKTLCTTPRYVTPTSDTPPPIGASKGKERILVDDTVALKADKAIELDGSPGIRYSLPCVDDEGSVQNKEIQYILQPEIPPLSPLPMRSLKGKERMRQEDVDAMMDLRALEEPIERDDDDDEADIPLSLLISFIKSSVQDKGKHLVEDADPFKPGSSKRVKFASPLASLHFSSPPCASSLTDSENDSRVSPVASSLLDEDNAAATDQVQLAESIPAENIAPVAGSLIDKPNERFSPVASSLSDSESLGRFSPIASSVSDDVGGRFSPVASSMSDDVGGRFSPVASSVSDDVDGRFSPVASSVSDDVGGRFSPVASSVSDDDGGRFSPVASSLSDSEQ